MHQSQLIFFFDIKLAIFLNLCFFLGKTQRGKICSIFSDFLFHFQLIIIFLEGKTIKSFFSLLFLIYKNNKGSLTE